MSSSTGRPPRSMSASKSFQASQSIFPPGAASSSRPFLNMINPMSRTYQGYTQANQSLVEEEEDENRGGSEDDGERDLEAGRNRGSSTIFQSTIDTSKSRTQGKRRVSWDAGTSEMNTLHPNIHQEDKMHEQQSSDDEVPQSFMIEAASHKPPSKAKAKAKAKSTAGLRSQPLHSVSGRKLPPTLPTVASHALPPSVSIPPRPSELDTGGEENHARGSSTGRASTEPSFDRERPRQMGGLDAHGRALWNWVNVYNLDAFLQEVYYYYEGKGIYSIALSRGLNLLTVGFVIGFSTFLVGCIDYSRIRPEKVTRLSDVVVDRCVSKFSGFTLLFFLFFTAFYSWQIISFVLGVYRLVDMYNFYTHLLNIPDADIQTISWPEVVRRIGAIREENPFTAHNTRHTDSATTAKLDAHDIANRIMRQENYLIALFNKELLDLRVPLPQLLTHFFVEEEGRGKMLTRALEWNLRFCLMEYLFDQHGRVRKVFLKSKNRGALIEGLRRRFIFMGILNAIFAPFIVPYLLMYSFFRYFEEYHKNPSSIGGRRYTPFAQWKFREFNELPHIFARRLDESHPLASMYIGQFPNEKMTLIMRFVAFIAGSFAAVLALSSILDPDLIVHFEITQHRTVLFYLGVFGSVLAVARGMIPDDNRVFDPELLMMEVITYTHYMPDGWKGQLHSKKVHQEFGELFAMKVMIFVQELLSVVLTPFVLWFSLPQCAPAIIDFFREFSVHVDGRGYVCSFAEFNFERHGNVKFGAPRKASDQRMISNEGKMEKSFLNFKAANPDWNPTDPSGSLYLSRIADISAPRQSTQAPQPHHPSHPYHPSHPQYLQHHRRRHGTGLDGTVLLEREAPADRSQAYDLALRQSQHAAATRRRMAGSVVASAGVSGSSVFGPQTAQTAVLGDSNGSIAPLINTDVQEEVQEDIPLDEGLGEEYVDGTQRRTGGGVDLDQEGDGYGEGEEGLEEGGVLRLLAQIYGARGVPQGPARVI